MKRYASLVLLLIILSLAISLAGCGDGGGGSPDDTPDTGETPDAEINPDGDNNEDEREDPPVTPEWKPKNQKVTLIDEDEPSDSLIIFADGLSYEAGELNSLLVSRGLPEIEATLNTKRVAKHRILLGKTGSKASELAEALCNEKSAEAPDDFHWAFVYYDGDLAIYANGGLAYEKALSALTSEYAQRGKLAVRDTLSEAYAYTRVEYNAYLSSLDETALSRMEEKKKENEALLDDIIAQVTAQRSELREIEGRISPEKLDEPIIKLFSTYTPDLGTHHSGTPTATPVSDHPRLLINSETVKTIRIKLLEDDENTAWFKENMGNRSLSSLEVIQANALAYALYGDPYYGYLAIYQMKYNLAYGSFILSSDQFRLHGYAMFTAAVVYDWCYDLLTEEDKIQIISGVENRLCRGSNSKGTRMEIGFPPSEQSAVASHACEHQLLRDYLSFAVAIYGDNNSWWTYVAGRFYNEYVPVRNYYYASGISPQGTGYYTLRLSSDLWSAWIIKIATGENPYSNMEEILRTILCYELSPDEFMTVEDDNSGDHRAGSRYSSIAYLSAYLFDDSTVLGFASESPISNANGRSGYITFATYVALCGLSDVKPSADRYAELDLIRYNGHPVGQYIVHSAWKDPDAVTVFMRIKERSTGNHEHEDSGTFEIYYKGMLTSDGGVYSYTSTHTAVYHKATISHNGLIIFDPSKSKTNGGYYSGGQRSIYGSSTSNLQTWLGEKKWETGKVTARAHAYIDDDVTSPLYAYIAGDITAAYEQDSVQYAGRRMLTVFTSDADFPMVFFVFDSISSKRTCERRFLLQISSADEPTVDAKNRTVITENGNGKLVLTCLTKDVSLRARGGRNEGRYDATLSQNYLVNGKQIVPATPTGDDGHWGRVEIVHKSTDESVTFMNVIYVTDRGSEKSAEVTPIKHAVGLEGGAFNQSIIALFATARDGAREALSCTVKGEGDMSYYVSGVAEGDWEVFVDERSCGVYTATAEGGLLTFTAPAGKLVISPVNQ